MRGSQIVNWNQFMRDGKFTAQLSKLKEQYIMDNAEKLAR
jgi:hypothetical protein